MKFRGVEKEFDKDLRPIKGRSRRKQEDKQE